MPKAHSEDLRKRVVEAYQASGDSAAVAERFAVNRRNVTRWAALERDSGSIANNYANCGRKPAIKADDYFVEFAKAHTHNTLSQMIEAYGGGLSLMSMSRALARIGFTRKKRLTTTLNATKKSVKNS